MAPPLKRFRVTGLYGRKTIDVPLESSTLILVGENGTSKSTFINLVYFVLTRQWSRLREHRFHSIEAEIGDFHFEITQEMIEEYASNRRHHGIFLERTMPSSLRLRFRKYAEEHSAEDLLTDEVLMTRLSEEIGISPRRVREMVLQFSKEDRPSKLHQLGKQISTLNLGQFLYLPTYRRIEQDLKSIFRDAEMEDEIKRLRERLASRAASHFTELVQFGMEDVGHTFAARMNQIKENVRKGLDNLTGTYLREVIQGGYSSVDVNDVRNIDVGALDSMFARVDEATLPAAEKDRLKERIAEMATRPKFELQDRVIAHFISKLVALHSEQQANEKDVRDFIAVCNGYLGGKELVYDNTSYTIYVRPAVEQGEQLSILLDPLELKSLSSGEKQIVSLFSHIYLSGKKDFFVVIDEPELSLSVPWQRKFLPDILKSEMCSGLISVTHSPFIWENELEHCVRPISAYTEPYHVVR